MEIFDKFSGARVLVIGDIMLDRYWWGTVTRISPEAPVPIVKLDQTSTVLGGAANVAANVVGLGSEAILVGAVGDDDDGKLLRQLLSSSKISSEFTFILRDRPTSVKTRVVAHGQQVVRVDQEVTLDLSESDTPRILDAIRSLFKHVDIVVISDYAKGFLTDDIVSKVISMARSEKLVLVDPKGKTYGKYRGASILTPNMQEAANATDISINSKSLLETAARTLIKEVDLEAVVITQGEDGMSLFQRDTASVHIRSALKQVYDVTGAGDTVIGTLAVALACGSSLREAANLANSAAGIVVEEVGTTAISQQKLREALSVPSEIPFDLAVSPS